MSGEAVAGLTWRQPAIGAFSMQAVKYQVVPNLRGDYYVANEQLRKVIATDLGEEAMSLGSMRLSPLVGMAADTDGDIVAAMLASPQLEANLAQHVNKQTSLDLYQQFTLRQQLLKAKAGSGGLSISRLQAMAGNVVKLGIPETQLGRQSLSLQKARGAVLGGFGGLSEKQSMDALSLLEWMEQTLFLVSTWKQARPRGW